MSGFFGSFFGSFFGDFFGDGEEAGPTPEMVLPSVPRPYFCYPVWSDAFETETPPVWSGPGWRAGLPASNVGTLAFDQFARSVDLDYANTVLICDLQQVCGVGAVVIPHGNYSRSATARVTLATSSGALITSPVHQSAFFPIWSQFAPARVPRSFRAPLLYFVRTAGELALVNATHAMIEVRDATNPAGYLQVNRAMVTGLIVAPTGMRPGVQHVPVERNEYTQMDGGNTIVNRRPAERTTKYALGLLEETESYGPLYRMESELASTGGQVFQGWDTEDPLYFDRAYTARLTPTGVHWEHPMYQRRELQFTEVL